MPVPQKPRGEMTEAERLEARRKNKRALYLRRVGRPIRISPEEFAEVKTLVMDCPLRGMAFAAMSDQTGVIRHIFGDIVGGRRKSLNRDTYEKVRTLRFEPPPPESRTGSYVDPTGAVRRLEALRAQAFPLKFLADRMGVEPQNIRYSETYRKGIQLGSRDRIDRLYEELRNRKPEEFGISKREINRQYTVARNSGFAPPSCWDDDTIDDPAAVPEWTGACNTPEGYRIHVREGIPLCTACKLLIETRPVVMLEDLIFFPEALRSAMSYRGMTIAVLAEKSGLSPDSLLRWRTGDRSPRYRAQVDRIASILGIDTDELVRVRPQPEVPPTLEVIPSGVFNPYVLSTVLNLNAIPKRGAALTLGLNEGSISQWLERKAKPRDPALLTPLAAQVGMKVEEFYP